MYEIVDEGETKLYIPVDGAFGKRVSGMDRKAPVFYNPNMALNRDISVLFMKSHEPELVFADVLAGSGAKGVRIATESGNTVFLNDANKDAVEIIKKNSELNRLDVTVSNCDANSFMLENNGCFDFIDIDPFGSPVPFLDAALLTSKKKGFLGVTATDTATLCGVYPDTCYRRYQAVPLHSDFCHEVGLRILLGYVARSAAKYDRGIKPVLSHYTRHYFRLYVKVEKGVILGKDSLDSMGYLYYCKQCRDFSHERERFPSEKTCVCGHKLAVSGPLWLGDLHEHSLLSKMCEADTRKKTEKVLKNLLDEVTIPFYFNVHVLAKDIGVSAASLETIIERLRKLGFTASRTHFTPIGIKTDAPVDAVKKVLS